MDINYGVVILCAVLSVPLGFVWYGPLFGKAWMNLAGIKMPEGVKPSMGMMIKPMIISIIGAFLLAFSIAHSIKIGQADFGLSGASLGMKTAFWNWLGYIIPAHLSFVAWEGKPWRLFWIYTGYWLVLLAIMGAILAVWQ